MEFIVSGENASIRFDILRRERLVEDYWDGNWLVCRLAGHVGCFKFATSLTLRTDELAGFAEGLEEVYKTIQGRAELQHMEEIVSLKMQISPTGGIAWSGYIRDPICYSLKLDLSFKSDQSYLPATISSLRKILVEFPVVGKP